MLLSIVLLLVAVVFWFLLVNRLPYPPGPRGIPFVGMLNKMGSLTYLTFTDWSKKYGPLISFTSGFQRIIVVNSIPVAKKMFIEKSQIYNSRNQGYLATSIITRGGRSITMAPYPGSYWTNVRRLAVAVLRRKEIPSYYPIFLKETRSLIQSLLTLGKNGTEAIDPADSCVRFAFNTILTAAFGYRVEKDDDPIIKELKDVNDEVFAITVVDKASRILDFYPFLRYFPLPILKKATELRDRREALSLRFLKKLKEDIQSGTAPECFAKYLLEHASEEKMEDLDIINLSAALMIAGSDAPSITLQWFFLLLANHPQIQEKIHTEMDRVVGKERAPSTSDFENLHYLRCVLRETMRYRPKSFLGIAHATATDDTVEVEGKKYFIPKGSIVMLNSYAIDFDPERHTEPNKFMPERYLSFVEPTAKLANGDQSKRDHFAFGIGNRICPGIDFAEQELFCAISMIMWALKIERPTNELLDQETVRVSRSFSPTPYRVNFVARMKLFA